MQDETYFGSENDDSIYDLTLQFLGHDLNFMK